MMTDGYEDLLLPMKKKTKKQKQKQTKKNNIIPYSHHETHL